MFSLIENNVFLKLLVHADWLSKLIVFALVIMSIACWWIFFYKLYAINIKLAHVRYARNRLYAINTGEELAHLASALKNDLAGELVIKVVTFMRTTTISNTSSHVSLHNANRSSVKLLREKHDAESIKMVIDQSLSEIMRREESFVPVVRMSAETGTLIGLFGTVWGLIHAFNRISERQTADIPTVAPGIAEALIVTLTGLFVAIPAMVQYFVIMKKVDALEGELNAVANRLEWLVTHVIDISGRE